MNIIIIMNIININIYMNTIFLFKAQALPDHINTKGRAPHRTKALVRHSPTNEN